MFASEEVRKAFPTKAEEAPLELTLSTYLPLPTEAYNSSITIVLSPLDSSVVLSLYFGLFNYKNVVNIIKMKS